MEGPVSDCKIQRLSVNASESKEDKNDSNELDGETVLIDMMDNICCRLNIHDLCYAAQVCRSWNKEVLREMEKRYLEHKVLPYLFSKELMGSSFHVSKILNIKPYVTLLFPGTNRQVCDVRDEVDLEYDTFKTYRKQFPNKLVVVGVFESMIDEDLIHSCPVTGAKEVLEQYIPAGTLSLSLPINKRLSIKESHILESEFLLNYEAEFKKMIDELKPDCSNSKSTLIIFVANPDTIFTFRDKKLTAMLSMIKTSFVEQSYTLWGLVTSYKIFASGNNDKTVDNIGEKEARVVGLNLTGSNLESWSTIINVNISKRDMEKKLRNFKDRIRLKRCNMGFITAPVIINEPSDIVCYSDNHELVNNVKKIFSEIPFVGTFCEDEDFYFGVDSMCDDSDGLMSHEIISIMIFSYD